MHSQRGTLLLSELLCKLLHLDPVSQVIRVKPCLERKKKKQTTQQKVLQPPDFFLFLFGPEFIASKLSAIHSSAVGTARPPANPPAAAAALSDTCDTSFLSPILLLNATGTHGAPSAEPILPFPPPLKPLGAWQPPAAPPQRRRALIGQRPTGLPLAPL